MLNIAHNNIGALPPSVANLTKMTRLDLSSTQIPYLPKFISNLNRLCILDVRNTRMKIPLALANRIESNAVMAGYYK